MPSIQVRLLHVCYKSTTKYVVMAYTYTQYTCYIYSKSSIGAASEVVSLEIWRVGHRVSDRLC